MYFDYQRIQWFRQSLKIERGILFIRYRFNNLWFRIDLAFLKKKNNRIVRERIERVSRLSREMWSSHLDA